MGKSSRGLGLRGKIYLLTFGMVAILVVITLLLNYLLLPKYYMAKREEVLKECFVEVVEELRITEIKQYSYIDMFELLENKNAVRIIVCDSLLNNVYGNGNIEYFTNTLMPISEKRTFEPDYQFPASVSSIDFSEVTTYIQGDNNYSLNYVKVIGLVFVTKTGYYLINVDMTVDAANSSAAIFTNFLLFVTAAVILLGGLTMFFVSGKLVSPIKQMNDAARKMSVLDFSTKISINSKDEVGELARSVNEMSGKLESAVEGLQSANKQLKLDLINREKTDVMRREFISNVSHELKTPISLILGYAEGLKAGINEDERDFYCDVITDEAQNMSKLVSRLLYITQIDSNAMKPDISRFNICDLIDGAAENLKILFDEQGISFERDYRFNETVCADIDQIRQVISNYLVNALNHCSGEKRISVSTAPVGEKGFRCSVFNTGEHIPAEHIDRIWDSFYKVDKARTREYGGTGLGLYIVSRIIGNHGGKYGVENVKDGVVFWFELDTD